jgi:N-acetylneuraminic acid mutarotase
MFRLASIAFVVLAVAQGSWTPMPAAPIASDVPPAAAWTGTQLLVFGRHVRTARDARGNPYVVGRTDVAASYDPRAKSWRRLSPPQGTGFMGVTAVWTGRELIVWGQGTRVAYNPRTNRWRRLPSSPLLAIHDGFGVVAWTGRELLGWGGGCCGDAFDDGVAYNPATNRWRALPRSPLAGSQHPLGAWTGRELVVLVGNDDPEGNPWPKRLARAAAYDPSTNRWRRIAPLPVERNDATAVWDGHEVLVLGGARAGFAYSPHGNRWRRLPALPIAPRAASAVWTGTRAFLWSGSRAFAYDPRGDRWSTLPRAPIAPRGHAAAIWTGDAFLVWGGDNGKGGGRSDGAVYTPR